jgi:hypothetical protein
MKITSEQAVALRDWREDVVTQIADVLHGQTSVTSEEDWETAELIYDHLLAGDFLNLPDLPEKPLASGGLIRGGSYVVGSMAVPHD